MIIGQTVRVIANEGGLFCGRTGRVVKIDASLKRTWLLVSFDDEGQGAGGPLPFWFAPDELEMVSGDNP